MDFDPEVDFSQGYREMFTSRGVAGWQDINAKKGPCRARVLGTLDARLIAIDADTGQACDGFGRGGEVDLSKDIPRYRERDYSVTSPPTVVRHEVMDYIVVTAGGGLAGGGGRGDFVVAYRAAAGEIDDRSAPVSARLP